MSHKDNAEHLGKGSGVNLSSKELRPRRPPARPRGSDAPARPDAPATPALSPGDGTARPAPHRAALTAAQDAAFRARYAATCARFAQFPVSQ